MPYLEWRKEFRRPGPAGSANSRAGRRWSRPSRRPDARASPPAPRAAAVRLPDLRRRQPLQRGSGAPAPEHRGRRARARSADPTATAAAIPDGFDCSGLVQYVFGQSGVKLPRSSRDQSGPRRRHRPGRRRTRRPAVLQLHRQPHRPCRALPRRRPGRARAGLGGGRSSSRRSRRSTGCRNSWKRGTC